MENLITVNVRWQGENPLTRGRKYQVHGGDFSCEATVLGIKHLLKLQSGERLGAEHLGKGEQALVDLALSEDISAASCGEESLESCWLSEDGQNVGQFKVKHVLRRSTNVVWQQTDIDRNTRAAQKNQKPKTFWFTGLSGSGKSTLANELEKKLVEAGCHTMLLDGDNIRHGLCKNLGFKEVDRIENIRRVAEVAKLMNDAGLIVLAAFIAPYKEDRATAREIIGDSFIEVYVSTPLEECERRDIKGLYAKARAGLIPNFTGINAPYEAPESPHVRIDTSAVEVETALAEIMQEFIS